MISVLVIRQSGAFCGVTGMFLSSPLTTNLKIIFDHFESLKPGGFVPGNILPAPSIIKFDLINKEKHKQMVSNLKSNVLK